MAATRTKRTKGGSMVFRHAERDDDWRPPAEVDAPTMQAIEDHIARHVARPKLVLHEILSDTIHLDVHVVPPARRHPYWLLYTTGMSALPMTVHPEADSNPYAEVMIFLPPDWKCDERSMSQSRWYWPVQWLKMLGRLPHDHQTWLAEGHTVPNGDPAKPFDRSTKLACMLLAPSVTLPPEAQRVRVRRRAIDLLTLWPIHVDEMQLKLDRGHEALVAALAAAKVGDIIDPGRASVVPKSRSSAKARTEKKTKVTTKTVRRRARS
jgi:hypothetical protein